MHPTPHPPTVQVSSQNEITSVACVACADTDFDTENPIIVCDGEHDPPVGYHMRCVDLAYVPSTDWLCPPCIKDEKYLIKSVHGKRKRVGDGKVEYLVRWVGHGDCEAWQLWQDIPAGSRRLVRDYNAQA